jgi:hypothetical protein
MKVLSRATDQVTDNIRWAARVCGLVVVGIFLLILVFAFTNEEGIHAQAAPKVVLMVAAICGVGLAWRWARVGGAVLVASSVALGLSMFQTRPMLAPVGLLLALLIYAAPPLMAGVLFMLSRRRS